MNCELTKSNLKIAWRNLMKYRLQTCISILSLAVGMVVIATIQAVLSHYAMPTIFSQPHLNRSYRVHIYEGIEPSDNQDFLWIDTPVH